MAAVRARVVAIPAWVWLTGIVVASAAVRIALGHRIVAPWIMIDELVYSELAKSFAAHGQFLVRGVPSHGYGFVYPVLIAPAWAIFTRVPDAYAAAKAINGVVMSLTAIPAYFLARRLLSQRLALVAAVMSVLVPSMLYTGTMMTENAFYPVFVTFSLALVLMLERPTRVRQLLVLALFALAYATRQQAIALVPAFLVAPVLQSGRRLRPYMTLYGIVAAGVVLALLDTVARGRSPLTLLGAYRAATTSSYSAGAVVHFVGYQLGEIDLYLGVIPFAALLALWFAPGKARAFAAATLPVFAFLTVEVAAFASQASVDKIEERNLFYVAPFALIALFALPQRRRPMLIAAAIAGVLPVLVDFPRFITTSAVADTFALLPWWWVQDHLITLGQVRWAALGVSLVAAAAFAFVPHRYVLVLASLVAVYFVLTTAVVENGRHGIHQASLGKLWAGIHNPHPDWIDRAVGANASVTILRNGLMADETIWEDEFFNRSVRAVDSYDVARVPDPLPETKLTPNRDGYLGIHAEYVLGEDVVGKIVATDQVPPGIDLYKVNGPLYVRIQHVHGLYPRDTWSGRRVSWTIDHCTGGTVTVPLETDGTLYKTAQTVVAYVGGRAVARASIAPTQQTQIVVPLRGYRGSCSVRFVVGRTLVPGHGDPRHLGAHFLGFDYAP